MGFAAVSFTGCTGIVGASTMASGAVGRAAAQSVGEGGAWRGTAGGGGRGAGAGARVIAGGAGVLVLEELEHARARGARIYAEVVGYGATSDGFDMVAPSGEGAIRCMQLALKGLDGNGVGCGIDYINPHGTSTPIGDLKEIEAIRAVFGSSIPPISGTKSLTGHSLGAIGVQEAVFSIIMMNNGFIAESANIEELDPEFADIPIVRQRIDNAELNCVMSNSFGFGGTNATLVFKRYN